MDTEVAGAEGNAKLKRRVDDSRSFSTIDLPPT